MSNFELLSLVFSFGGAGAAMFNVWLSGKVKEQVQDLKIYCLSTFATKDELKDLRHV